MQREGLSDDVGDGNGALDESDMRLALSILTDRNATAAAVCDAALALDGAIQATQTLLVTPDDELFVGLNAAVLKHHTEPASVIALLRLCSTLLLLDLVDHKGAAECGIVNTLADLLRTNKDNVDVQAACLQLASILCYEPSFFALAEQTDLCVEVLEALRHVRSSESELQGLAIVEVMLESDKLRQSPDVIEVVVECVRASYSLDICRSGACILASLSSVPVQLQAIVTHADMDFLATCIQTLQADVESVSDVLVLLDRALQDNACSTILAQDCSDDDSVVERLVAAVQQLQEVLGTAMSAETRRAISLCHTVLAGIDNLRHLPQIADSFAPQAIDFAPDSPWQLHRVRDEDSSEREHADTLQARQETVARRHQLGAGILEGLQSHFAAGDETLQKVQLLAELANSSHMEVEQSLKRLADWHQLHERTMQQLQLLDDENKELRLKLTEASMTIDHLSQELQTSRQNMQRYRDQDSELRQALDAVRAANQEAEEWQRRYQQLEHSRCVVSATQQEATISKQDNGSMRRTSSERTLRSFSSELRRQTLAHTPADTMEHTLQIVQEMHHQFIKNQYQQEGASPPSFRTVSRQPSTPQISTSQPTADEPRLRELASLTEQLFSALASTPSSVDPPTFASTGRVRRCLRTLAPVDGRNVVAGDIDVLLSNSAAQSQVKSKTTVNFPMFLRALLQLLTKRYDLQNWSDLLDRAIAQLRKAEGMQSLQRTASERTLQTTSAQSTSAGAWIDHLFDTADARDLEGVKMLLDKNGTVLGQIFAAYTTSTPRSHSRLQANTMDFQCLLTLATDFELVPTIVDKDHCWELYDRICAQSQVAPQIGISVKGFMELLGVMALTSNWLLHDAGLTSATDRMIGLLKHMDATDAKQKLRSRSTSIVGNFVVR